ncbi:MAG: RNA methyltransferase [Verrucomicrobia bacterium]|jgi:tRNA G18 (ribose-2'-O)-methylase SpoU|nr:RNA methyltransferase [Verrucomicrobiota bacterium]
MLQIRQIDSLDHPSLAPYRTMRRAAEHVQQGIFVAEGDKVVHRLLENPELEIVSLLVPPGWMETHGAMVELKKQPIEVFIAEKKVLETLIGFPMYQGVLAVGRIPSQPSLESVLEDTPRPRLFLAADALANAANMGAVMRNCAAFGVQAMVVGETCSPPWMRRSVRSSMGAIFDLPMVETDRLVMTLGHLRQAGLHVVGAHPHADGRSLAQVDLRRDVCIVVGSEGTGLRAEVLAACDEHAAIPMQCGVDSLNVTCASSVFLYEANRQRGKG